MSKTVGLINLHSNITFKGLTDNRPVASVSYLGRYAIIDVVLSNMSNSNLDSVGILIQNHPRSLIKHMGSGNEWNFNLKKGDVSLLYNEKYAMNRKYNSDINNIVENIAFLRDNNPDYVVIAPAHIITTMNYDELVEEHIKSGAQISMVYQHVEDADTAWIGSDYVTIKDDQVDGIFTNKGDSKKKDISLETYVFNASALKELIEYAQHISAFYSVKDALANLVDERAIHAIEYKGYCRCLDSMEHYLEYSLELLDLNVSTQVFKSNWPIFTRTNDTPPTKYKEHARVKSSFVANGALIDGRVENSIIGRNVVIGKGAVVKNSIVFTGSVIAEGAYLDGCIIDKRVKVEHVKELVGTKANPLYVKEGDIV